MTDPKTGSKLQTLKIKIKSWKNKRDIKTGNIAHEGCVTWYRERKSWLPMPPDKNPDFFKCPSCPDGFFWMIVEDTFKLDEEKDYYNCTINIDRIYCKNCGDLSLETLSKEVQEFIDAEFKEDLRILCERFFPFKLKLRRGTTFKINALQDISLEVLTKQIQFIESCGNCGKKRFLKIEGVKGLKRCLRCGYVNYYDLEVTRKLLLPYITDITE